MNNECFIKLTADIQNHWTYKKPETFKWWIDLLIMSNHEDRDEFIGNRIENCPNGTFYITMNELAKRWGISKSSAVNFIDSVRKRNDICTQTCTQKTRITICNIDTYALNENTFGTQKIRKTNAKQTQNEPIISCFTFDEFWGKYPNKTARAESQKKYDLLTETDRELIKNTIDYFINNKPFEKYSYPMATTYINQKRWLDIIAQPKQEVTQPEIFDFSKPTEQSTAIKF